MYRKLQIVVFLAAGLALTAPVLAQTTFYVDGINGNNQGGANDCTDPGFPCQSISHAVANSFGGDIIEIADATYTEVVDIPRSLALRGESEDGTIIQAHANLGQATDRVITIDGAFEVTISDLTIRRGKTTAGAFPDGHGGGLFNRDATLNISNVTFSQNEADTHGGGMYNSNGNLALTDVTFNYNQAIDFSGGGIETSGSDDVTLTNVVFSNNVAGDGGGGMRSAFSGNVTLTNVTFSDNIAERGGGMANLGSLASATLTNVTFSNNEAGTLGGGMRNWHAEATLTDVTFSGNSSLGEDINHGGGGLIAHGTDATLTLTDVTFVENTAVRGGGMRINDGAATLGNVRFIDNEAQNFGGGIYVQGSTPLLRNVLFYGNTAVVFGGGGMFNFTDARPSLANVTFSGNSAGSTGGGIRNGDNAEVSFINSIIWGNTASTAANEISVESTATVELTYSLYSNGPGDILDSGDFSCDFCVTDDPLFRDQAGGNLRLNAGSPAIDAGAHDTLSFIFPEGDNGEPIDLDGNPRFYPGEEDIDIGAYEWQPLTDDIFQDRFEQ